jgi:hypothetical protein
VDESPKASPSRAVASLAKERFEWAKEAYDRVAEDNKRGGFNPEILYLWSKRLLRPQRAIARNKDEEVAAYRAHVKRMADVEKFANELFVPPRRPGEIVGHITPAQLAAARFYRAEAELWLARAKPPE